MLDVGAGTGVLSLACAQAGAKHVYAVEACAGISLLSREIAKANNMQDRITCINELVEHVVLPVAQVDIIVSEWMGMYLLHESMVNSVIHARDKYLKPDVGRMFPTLAYLYMCPVEMSGFLAEHVKYWDDFHGFNYAPVKRVYQQLLLEKPLIDYLAVEQLVGDEKIVATLDMRTVTLDDIRTIQFYDVKFVADRDCHLDGFAFWFDVVFETDAGVVTLSTAPGHAHTHWKQTIVFLPNAINADDGDTRDSLDLLENESFECYLIMNQTVDNCRHYEIDIGMTKLPDRLIQKPKTGETDDITSSTDEEDEHPMPCDCSNIKCVLIKATLAKYEEQSKSPNQ